MWEILKKKRLVKNCRNENQGINFTWLKVNSLKISFRVDFISIPYIQLFFLVFFFTFFHLNFITGAIEDVAVSVDGALYSTIGSDKAMKVFDVVNFGLCNL